MAKTVKKAARKAAKKPVKKAASKGVKKGDKYVCGVCGMAVTVAEPCGCMDACDIVCCGEPMKTSRKK